MYGVGDTHFSSEESGIFGLQTFLLFFSLAAFGYLCFLYSKMR